MNPGKSVSVEQEAASLLPEEGVSSLGSGELRRGEEGDLHALKSTNDGHEEEIEED